MQDVAQQVIALSDERDQWHLLIIAAWCEGYRAGELAHADDYARGVLAGAAARKHAEHDLVEWARLEVLRWGDPGREHFGDPRPGDFPGRERRTGDRVRTDTPPSHRGGQGVAG